LLGIKSPTLCGGYWNDSARTFQSRKRGFWLTGDVVIRRRDGEFVHLDRQVDTVSAARGPIYTLPLEERVLLHSADILDCSVIGVATAGGEQPVAVLKLQRPAASPGPWLTALNADLAQHGHAPLAGVAIARSADEFPLGPTGKVLKRRLRELAPTLFDATNPAAARTA
jgi:acyl-coenzyme A synthetase/AMP-(fatty) acid ligase